MSTADKNSDESKMADINFQAIFVELKKSVCAVEVNQNKDKVFATMLLNGRHIRFQLDSGATVNVISQNDYSEAYGKESLLSLETTNATLVMYNKSEEKPLGKKRVRVVNPKNGKKYSVEFVVVKGSCTSLLSAKASQQMGLLSVNRNNILAISIFEMFWSGAERKQ